MRSIVQRAIVTCSPSFSAQSSHAVHRSARNRHMQSIIQRAIVTCGPPFSAQSSHAVHHLARNRDIQSGICMFSAQSSRPVHHLARNRHIQLAICMLSACRHVQPTILRATVATNPSFPAQTSYYPTSHLARYPHVQPHSKSLEI